MFALCKKSYVFAVLVAFACGGAFGKSYYTRAPEWQLCSDTQCNTIATDVGTASYAVGGGVEVIKNGQIDATALRAYIKNNSVSGAGPLVLSRSDLCGCDIDDFDCLYDCCDYPDGSSAACTAACAVGESCDCCSMGFEEFCDDDCDDDDNEEEYECSGRFGMFWCDEPDCRETCETGTEIDCRSCSCSSYDDISSCRFMVQVQGCDTDWGYKLCEFTEDECCGG